MEGSFIEMEPGRVKDLAQARLDRITKLREEALRDAIESARNGRVRSFFRKLFRLQPPSDDEVKAELSQGFMNTVDMIEMSYGRQEDVAQKLLVAARHAQTVVVVSAGDLSLIT